MTQKQPKTLGLRSSASFTYAANATMEIGVLTSIPKILTARSQMTWKKPE
jgi:hypothetical protein